MSDNPSLFPVNNRMRANAYRAAVQQLTDQLLSHEVNIDVAEFNLKMPGQPAADSAVYRANAKESRLKIRSLKRTIPMLEARYYEFNELAEAEEAEAAESDDRADAEE